MYSGPVKRAASAGMPSGRYWSENTPSKKPSTFGLLQEKHTDLSCEQIIQTADMMLHKALSHYVTFGYTLFIRIIHLHHSVLKTVSCIGNLL